MPKDVVGCRPTPDHVRQRIHAIFCAICVRAYAICVNLLRRRERLSRECLTGRDARCGPPFHPLSHKGPDFVEMPRAEIMCIDADIHGKRSGCVREVPMRMSVQVPRSMMGAIPDAHSIVTDHTHPGCDFTWACGPRGETRILCQQPKRPITQKSISIPVVCWHRLSTEGASG
jgi:hypothetical protein